MRIEDVISNLSQNWKLEYTDDEVDSLITVFHRFPGEMPKTSNEGDKYIQDWMVNDHHKGILATSMYYLCKYFDLTPQNLSIQVLGEIAGQRLIHLLPYNNDTVIREAKESLRFEEDIQMIDGRKFKIQIGTMIIFLAYLKYPPSSFPYEDLKKSIKMKIYEIERELNEVIRDDISDVLIGFLIWCEKSGVHNPNVAPAIKRNEKAKRLFKSSIVQAQSAQPQPYQQEPPQPQSAPTSRSRKIRKRKKNPPMIHLKERAISFIDKHGGTLTDDVYNKFIITLTIQDRTVKTKNGERIVTPTKDAIEYWYTHK